MRRLAAGCFRRLYGVSFVDCYLLIAVRLLAWTDS